MEPPGALSPWRRRITRGLGMVFGAYLENDIRDAYAFLMKNYRDDDKVFLFGFSRGAYTVRAVASLLRIYGLLRPDNESMVPSGSTIHWSVYERGPAYVATLNLPPDVTIFARRQTQPGGPYPPPPLPTPENQQ